MQNRTAHSPKLARVESRWLTPLLITLAAVSAGQAQDLSPWPAHLSGFESFRKQYPLKPVRDYTFLGTEQSEAKPVVRFDGHIELWFNPADHVSWIGQAIGQGSFQVELLDGYLPVVHYTYQKPSSSARCVMTAFAADAQPPGALHLYIRLQETEPGKQSVTRYFRLRDQADIGAGIFDAELANLRRHWADWFSCGPDFRGLEPELLNATRASLIRALITFTGRHPHYGVNSYGQTIHDGFPPTIIALVNCLLDWGHPDLARSYLAYYFERFVTTTGRFDYYGPSLAEYGQMLALVCRVHDAAPQHDWFEPLRPKVERMREWLWKGIDGSATGLLAGVPEADRRGQVDVYFHNNAWCWRGLSAIANVLGKPDQTRCDAYRRAILTAMNQVADRSTDPPFFPPVARRIKPFQSMTQDDLASYTNYRYWLELLSSGILPAAYADAIIRYRLTHGGEVGGLTHFQTHADNWPLAEYGAARLALGDLEAARHILFSHLAGHLTPQTWTAYEQVSLSGQTQRKAVADYCVPAQLVAPRLLAAWQRAASAIPVLKVSAAAGEVTVDGRLDEPCYQAPPCVEQFVIAGQPDKAPPKTKAWLLWQPERLICAFACEDPAIVASPPSRNEHDVDAQDRVELFLWSGRAGDPYVCLEIAARGAVHDYQARFYRRFEDGWSPEPWNHAVSQTAHGYQVEAAISRAALAAAGFQLQLGARWRAGLFRADFSPRQGQPEPVWITWVDAHTPEPDFHVAASFGEIVLAPSASGPLQRAWHPIRRTRGCGRMARPRPSVFCFLGVSRRSALCCLHSAFLLLHSSG